MTNYKPIDRPVPELLRAERRSNATLFVARWQSSVETLSGCASQKLHLELASSVPDAFTKFNSVGVRI